jgi:hypothetical protein
LTPEEELKVRAQAESQALAQFFQMAMNQYVILSGENAVLKAKVDELTPKKID